MLTTTDSVHHERRLLVLLLVGLLLLLLARSICGCFSAGGRRRTARVDENPLSQWSQWGQCSAACSLGEQARWRSSIVLPQLVERQSRSCTSSTSCYEWQPWSPWSACSITCGPASSSRRRERRCLPDQSPDLCIQPDVAMETEKRDCGNPDCPPVNGVWNQWNPWSNCLVTCGWGYRVRNRLCNNPAPSNGGAECGSSSAGYERCLGGQCPVDGHWGTWGACTHIQGSQCVTIPRDECREGLAMYCRQCDNPPPEFGGSPCVTGLATDRRECWNTDACNSNLVQPPMNFTVVGFINSNDLLVKWRRAPFGLPASSFSITWRITGTDSVGEAEVNVVARDEQKPLGESYEFWIRDLTANSELHITMATRCTAGGTLRISEPVQQKFQVSRVDGGWGQWGSYSSCSPTPDCNIPGSRSRSRKCDSPAPSNGGVTCPGSAVETSRCFHNC